MLCAASVRLSTVLLKLLASSANLESLRENAKLMWALHHVQLLAAARSCERSLFAFCSMLVLQGSHWCVSP